jgi:hypothetical protein
MRTRGKLSVVAVAGVLAMAIGAAPAAAIHSWGSYHWARTASPFSPALKLGDNVTAGWDSYLGLTSSDWSADLWSNPVRTTIVPGVTSGRKCRASSGRTEVCNASYGNNGWLGLASIWASGSHITQATVKVNDTYFNTTTYNTPAWRQSVMCQEVGHVFGLDHQSEDRNVNMGTCMDYYTVPNPRPNQHDYEQLAAIYQHLDSTTTIAASTSSSGHGRLKRAKESLYVEDLGGGHKRFVWVFWKDRGPHDAPPADAD